MKQGARFVLITTPVLLIGVPMLGLMTSIPGLLIASLLTALFSAKWVAWQRGTRFWPLGFLCALLPALPYGLFVAGYVWMLNEASGISGSPADAYALSFTDLLLFFLLNASLVMGGLLAGLLLWHHAFARSALLISPLGSPATAD